MRLKPPIIHVEERDEGHTAGYYEHRTRSIIIDPRQSKREFLRTVLHETMHHINPDLTEWQVENVADILENVLHRLGYRREK